jgi:predicted porin
LKKAIVAALAAAVTTLASAQVTVYGVMDQAVRSTDGDTSFVSGSHTPSFIGIKGSEHLAGGLTISFKLEGGVNAATGDMFGDQIFNQESSLSFHSTALGTITLGRADTSASEGIDRLAGFRNFGLFASTRGVEYARDRDSTIRYTSPDLAGAQFQIGHSLASSTVEKLDSVSVSYRLDRFVASVGHDRTESGHTYTAAGGSLSLSSINIGIMHGRRDAAIETKTTILSGSMPLGAVSLLASYNITDTDVNEIKVTNLGASYNFSKRTMILAAYQTHSDYTADFWQLGIVHKF